MGIGGLRNAAVSGVSVRNCPCSTTEEQNHLLCPLYHKHSLTSTLVTVVSRRRKRPAAVKEAYIPRFLAEISQPRQPHKSFLHATHPTTHKYTKEVHHASLPLIHQPPRSRNYSSHPASFPLNPPSSSPPRPPESATTTSQPPTSASSSSSSSSVGGVFNGLAGEC